MTSYNINATRHNNGTTSLPLTVPVLFTSFAVALTLGGAVTVAAACAVAGVVALAGCVKERLVG